MGGAQPAEIPNTSNKKNIPRTSLLNTNDETVRNSFSSTSKTVGNNNSSQEVAKSEPSTNFTPAPLGKDRDSLATTTMPKTPKLNLNRDGKKTKPQKLFVKAAPKIKPLNNFAPEAFKMLGGQASAKTPLTKHHGEKIIAARHSLPPHAPHSQKQDMYNLEVKIFDTLQKPNANVGDFFKSIGMMAEVEQKQEAPKYKQILTSDGRLRFEEIGNENPYNKYAGQQYAQANTGIVSDAYPTNAKEALTEAGKTIADMLEIKPTDQTKLDLKEIERKIEEAPNRWGINRNVAGTDNSEVQKILKRMDNLRNIDADEKDALLRDIHKLDDDNQELAMITTTLGHKFKDVQNRTFMYPHMMTDDELRGHLELSENVTDYTHFVEDNIGSIGDMIDVADKSSGKGDKGKILTALASKPAEVMFTLIDLVSGGIFNQYTDREKKYIVEMIKRGLIKDHHP